MFDGRWRDTVDRGTGPVGRGLQQVGISADVLTATGLVSAAATAVAVATGHFLAGASCFLILTGLHDLLDGPVAKASGTSSVRGAFFDSVTDRVSDALILGGIAWYLVSTHPGHLVLLPVRHPGRHLARLLPAGQGRVARDLGQGRPDGAGRTDDPARHRLPVDLVPRSRAVGDAGPDVDHRGGTLRQGVEAGRGATGDRSAAGSGAPAPVSAPRHGVPRGLRPAPRRPRHPAGGRGASGELSSRSGRTWRARQARTGVRQRAGRRHG